jgi:hypothetical protein
MEDHYGSNKLLFDEMMLISVLSNTLGLIFIVLTQWNNSPYVATEILHDLWHINLTISQ